MAPELLSRCADLLYQEAAYLDERRWAEWLALYTEDAEFWVPAWDEDGRPTGDLQSQLSLIYYSSRAGLEDRGWRLQAGLSPASSPLLRTCHLITKVRLTTGANGQPPSLRTGRCRATGRSSTKRLPTLAFTSMGCVWRGTSCALPARRSCSSMMWWKRVRHLPRMRRP